MTNLYQVASVEPRERITHSDFFNPRNRVTLLKLEDRAIYQVLLPTWMNLRRGDTIRLDDIEVRGELQRSPANS